MKYTKMKNVWKDLIKKVRKSKEELPDVLSEISEIATIMAIKTAVEKTPPTSEDSLRGTGTITGNLKSAWARDSITSSKKANERYVTILANNEPYASFVNDGHIMDKHFVPGLIINPYSGLLEKAPPGMEGGIMVGTKTKYVVGKYMKENALITYYKELDRQANKAMRVLDFGN